MLTKNTKVLIAELTKDCNSLCTHCSYWKNKSNCYLDINYFKKVFDEMKNNGLDTVMLTGGEPLLHPNLLEMLRLISQDGVKIKLASNGLLLDKYYEDIMCLADEIVISLDSSNKETYHKIRGVDAFNNIIDVVSKIINSSSKTKIKFSFLIQKDNFSELLDFIEFSKKIGVKDISFLVPNYFGDFNKENSGNAYYEKSMFMDESEIEEFEKKILPVLIDYINEGIISFNRTEKELYNILDYFKLQAGINSKDIFRNGKCRFPIDTVVLRADGTFNTCLFLPITYSCEKPDKRIVDTISEYKIKYLFENTYFNKYCAKCFEVSSYT